MAKVKYYYDPRTLSYRKIERSWKNRLREAGIFFTSSALLAILLFLAIDFIVDSPKEKRMKRELENMKLQYELVNNRIEQLDEVVAQLETRDDDIYRVIFEADPIPEDVRNAGFGGVNRYKNLEGFKNSDLLIETKKKLDVLTKKLYVQSKSYDEVIELAKKKEELQFHIV